MYAETHYYANKCLYYKGYGEAKVIKAVFLDIDDTLLSFSGYVKEAMQEGFALHGLPAYTEDMYPVFEKINNGLWRQIEEGTLSFQKLTEIRWNTVFRALGISFDGRLFEAYFRKKLFGSAVHEPGALPLLGYLSSKYPLCAVSNGPYEQQINRLRVGGMLDYFCRCFISSRVGAQKPDAAFFDHCFRDLRENGFPSLLPEEVMLIGDSLSADILGGKSYGMQTILYNKTNDPAKSTPMADYTVTHLSEIHGIL